MFGRWGVMWFRCSEDLFSGLWIFDNYEKRERREKDVG